MSWDSLLTATHVSVLFCRIHTIWRPLMYIYFLFLQPPSISQKKYKSEYNVQKYKVGEKDYTYAYLSLQD